MTDFLFKINHVEDEEILKISFLLPDFIQHSSSQIDMIEFKFTTGVYIEDSLEFGKFKLYISRYPMNANVELHKLGIESKKLLVSSSVSHKESTLNITFNEFMDKMNTQYVMPYLNILKLHFNNRTTYTPTQKEKTRVQDSYHICFNELATSLQEGMSFIPDVSHSEIKNITNIIDAHTKFKTFHTLNEVLPVKSSVSTQIKI
jgi:hypothetical protein